VKGESHDNEASLAGVAETVATVSPPKEASQHERVQRIIERGSPEELEAEVRSSQRFLENLKAPMASMVCVNKDAQYWVEQISKDTDSCWWLYADTQ
jgi:hypothetical protein